MDKIAVIIAGAVAVGLVIWWFFGRRTNEAVPAIREGDKQTAEIVVNGGYKPGIIQLEKGVPADLVFIRKDASACFEEVVLPDFGERSHLGVNKPHTIRITPNEAGEFTYSCGMNMFFGKVIVK